MKKNHRILFLLSVALFLLICGSLFIGRYRISLQEFTDFVMGRLPHATADNFRHILVDIRLPRIIGALLVGIGLSVSGAAYQAVFQNPMVSPNILGVGAATSFGIALSIILHAGYVRTLLTSFLTGLAAVVAAYGISKFFRYDKRLGLVLSGIMISTVFNALVSYVKLIADVENELPDITYWLMGSLSGINYRGIRFAIGPLLVGICIITALRWRINLFTMGEEEAQTFGINVERTKRIIILAATLLTAAAISLCGNIGFVGLVIPHFARMLVGDNYKYVIPASFLGGAAYLLLVDNLSRSISTYEVPIGILTSLIGAPVFFFLLMRRRYD
ncbi:MAG: iron ABC transporter permease [Eubacteriales bacterium]|nr:iron ABC transporter permease [Eubacteriales bacterium]